jgi:hypothetical protein
MFMLFPNLINFDCDEEGRVLNPAETRRRRTEFEPTYVCCMYYSHDLHCVILLNINALY